MYIYTSVICVSIWVNTYMFEASRNLMKLEMEFPSRDINSTFRKTKVVLTDAFLHAPSGQFKLRLADGFKSFFIFPMGWGY